MGLDGESDRFVWPPSSVAPTGADDSGPDVGDAGKASDRSSHARSRVADEFAGWDDVAGRSNRPGSSGVGGGLAVFGRELLGYEGGGFRRAAAASGWRPRERWLQCRRCGGGAGEFEGGVDGCGSCRGTAVQWDRLSALGTYEGVLADGLRTLKLGRARGVGVEIGMLLGQRVLAELGEAGIEASECVCVPVPSSWRSRVIRGVDHTRWLALGFSRATGVRVVWGLRRWHRPSQTSLGVGARAANVRGAFVASRRASDLRGSRVVFVLDDIRTTGATLNEAVRGLRGVRGRRERGVIEAERVWGIVAGVSGFDGRLGSR